jgi:hypothetical protein
MGEESTDGAEGRKVANEGAGIGTEDAGTSHASSWERWTDDRGPFYRSCAVIPFDSPSESGGGESGDGRPAIEFTSGLTRLSLRNLPTLMVVVLALYASASLLSDVTAGRLSLPLPEPGLATAGLLLAGTAVGGVWMYAVVRIVVSSLGDASVHRSVVFYATGAPLAVATAYAVYVAWTGSAPALTVQAAYFLMVLVAGHLLYDGLALRTENLFMELAASEIVDEQAYAEFYEELSESLGGKIDVGPVSVSRSFAFATVVALVPMGLPLITLSWNLWNALAYVPELVVTVLVVALAYDAFVLVYMFTELLRRDILVYRPFHPDEHGGFRDLGRFATRINTILLLVGGYVAYRFYTEGLYYYGMEGFTSPLGMVTWGVSYLAPVLAYVCFVVFWLYHSFWRLHRKMEEGRRKRLEELQRAERADGDAVSREFSDYHIDAPPWESIRSAPKWPVKRQGLFGLVVLDAVPVVATFVL